MGKKAKAQHIPPEGLPPDDRMELIDAIMGRFEKTGDMAAVEDEINFALQDGLPIERFDRVTGKWELLDGRHFENRYVICQRVSGGKWIAWVYRRDPVWEDYGNSPATWRPRRISPEETREDGRLFSVSRAGYEKCRWASDATPEEKRRSLRDWAATLKQHPVATTADDEPKPTRGEVVRLIRVWKIVYPPSGKPPPDAKTKEIQAKVRPEYEKPENKWPLPKRDTIRRARKIVEEDE
jgi:hypothetical protein